MTALDLPVAIFLIANVVRILAYAPQIIKIIRDDGGATAVSNTSWTLFGLSHFATALYLLWDLDDGLSAAVFAASGAACFLIVALTTYKRARAASALLASPSRAA